MGWWTSVLSDWPFPRLAYVRAHGTLINVLVDSCYRRKDRMDSPTELRTTELRTTELRTTELRTTQLWTTELRTTQLRKGLNFEKDLTSKDPTSNDSTSKRTQLRNWTSNLNFEKPTIAVFIWSELKRTQLRKGPNFKIELRICSNIYIWNIICWIGLG
jgi:hypothetical protein